MIWSPFPERAGGARKAFRGVTFTLNELLGWMMLIAGAAYWGGVIRTYRHDGPTTAVSIAQSILSDGAFNVAGWVMIGAWAKIFAPRAVASRWQIAGAMLLGLVFAVPTRQATIIGLLVLGLTLTFRSGTPHGRLVSTLLIGFVIEMVWTSTYLLPLHSAAAVLDAKVCAAVLRLAGVSVQADGNVLVNAQAANDVEILAFCASTFPLAGVAMAFIVVTLCGGRMPRFGDLGWFSLGILASIGLTEARLSFMALGEAHYHWMHDGDGGTLYSLTATGLGVAFPIMAMCQWHSCRTRSP
jgi:hypothetical protein